MVALSVLDQSPVPDGATAAEALHHTIALARAAERLGYRRYWLAEHHNTESLAGSAPEVLVAHIAGRTSSIRVGAGGILLPYYSPLKVAEVFRALHTLFPGRIDLGLGRTPGTDPVAAAALAGPGGRGDRDYPDQVADVVRFVDGWTAPDPPPADVQAVPSGPGAPEVWVLSSSIYGCDLAAGMGLPLSYAHFISPSFGPQVVASYRRRFRSSGRLPQPLASVGVAVVCAPTDEEAERLALSADLWRLRPEGAGRGPLLSVEDAERQALTDLDRELVAQGRDRRLAGAPERVADSLRALAAAYQVGELVVLTVCHDPAARLRSYELLARAMGLTGGR